jgi:hypothetical protein
MWQRITFLTAQAKCPDLPSYCVLPVEERPSPRAASRLEAVRRHNKRGSRKHEFAAACGFCHNANTARSGHVGLFWCRLAACQHTHVAHGAAGGKRLHLHHDHFLRVPCWRGSQVSNGHRSYTARTDLLVLSRECGLGRGKRVLAAVSKTCQPIEQKYVGQDGNNNLATRLFGWATT